MTSWAPTAALRVERLPGPSPEPEDGDLPARDVFTPGHVSNDGRFLRGTIGSGDAGDWYSVWMDQGRRYGIVLDGIPLPDEDANDLGGRVRLSVHENPDAFSRGAIENGSGIEAVATGSDGRRLAQVYTPRRFGIHWVSAAADGGGDYRVYACDANDDPAVDHPEDRSAVTLQPGVPLTGAIESAGNRDWFRMTLLNQRRFNQDRVYLIEVRGADTGEGNLDDARISGMYDADGNLIRYSGVPGQFSTVTDLGFTPGAAGINFTPPTCLGTYFLGVTGNEGATGAYTVSLRDVTDTTMSQGTHYVADFFHDVEELPPAGYVSPGMPAWGILGTYEAQLHGGETYVPPAITVLYRLNVQPGRRYRLSLTTTEKGNIDPDEAIESGHLGLYLFPIIGSPAGYVYPGEDPLELGEVYTGAFVFGQTENPDYPTITQEFVPTATWSHSLWGERPTVWHALIPHFSGWARYSLALSDITDLEDESELGWETTTGAVAVGGSVTGTIDVAHDADWFRVTLDSSKTYRITMRGASSSGGTLADPYLSIRHDSFGEFNPGPDGNDDRSLDDPDSEITLVPGQGRRVLH